MKVADKSKWRPNYAFRRELYFALLELNTLLIGDLCDQAPLLQAGQRVADLPEPVA